jgi:hypothetical protein
MLKRFTMKSNVWLCFVLVARSSEFFKLVKENIDLEIVRNYA